MVRLTIDPAKDLVYYDCGEHKKREPYETGAQDIESQWDTFVSTIESMGIDECISIKQDAYDRYLRR